MSHDVLLIVDRAGQAHAVHEQVQAWLSGDGFCVVCADSIASALGSLHRQRFDVALLELSLCDAEDGAVERLREAAPGLPVVVIAAPGDSAIAERAQALGAVDYLVTGESEAQRLCRDLRQAIARGRQAQRSREDHERYALAVQAARDGLWDWHLDEDRVFYSERYHRMLGFDPGGLDDSSAAWFDRIHAADVDDVKRALARHVDGHSEVFEVEYRMQHRDGSWRWMLSRGLALRQRGAVYRIAGSQTDVTKRKQVEQKLLHTAYHDELTGLPNRSLLLDRLSRAMLRSEKDDRPFALLAIQLDNYRSIGDSFGHDVLEAWTREVARTLAGFLGPVDTLARVGRDELFMLIEDAEDLGEVIDLAEQIQARLRRPVSVDDEELFTTASIGIVIGGAEDGRRQRPDEYLRDAGLAMNRAHAQGGGRQRVFDAHMHQRAVERLNLERDLRIGLERGEFRMQYQPIVSLRSGHVAGFEALLRWEHPTRGTLAPRDFIDVAEASDLLGPIFERMFPQVLADLSNWQVRYRRSHPLFVNVNLSRAQLADDNLEAYLDEVLGQHPIADHTLGFEMTESMMVEDPNLVEKLNKIKQRGIRLLLDDFGTGYSSLSTLKQFPIDALKIDKSFLADIGAVDDTTEIIRAIVTLAHTMAMEVTAEGVETDEQLRVVSNMGCELAQGYYFSKPMDPDKACRAIAHGFRPSSQAPPSGPTSHRARSRGRVLIVDDDDVSRDRLVSQLEEDGFEVITAADGHACLEIASAEQPDVVMLDIHMPAMDGIETCRKLKHSMETAGIPVLFVTDVQEDDALVSEALQAGGNDFLWKGASRTILDARLRSQVAIARSQAKLRMLAMTDELTGVFSRRYLYQSLRRAVKSSTRRGPSGLGVLLIDVDHFKHINDAHGHIAGDRQLKRIARTIDETTRETDVVARFGGEEFVVVVPDTDEDGVRRVAEKIRAEVERRCPSTISIGGAYAQPSALERAHTADDVEALVARLLREADAAMQRAKALGRNRACFAEADVADSA